MKIMVVRCDGDCEVLDIPDGSCRISENDTVRWKLHTPDGIDHFFRSSDGKYDGWSRATPMGGWTKETADAFAASYERNRVIIRRKKPGEQAQ